MSTQAQIDANRRNAQHSTGPKTEAGKANSSRNATRFGLFATNNCILSGEQEEYDTMCHIVWDELSPVGGLEELMAGEYVRCAWRLRRCAMAEQRLGQFVTRQQEKDNARTGKSEPPADPILNDTQRDTLAIIRAYTQALNAQKRAKAELDKLQAARRARPTQTEAKPALRQDLAEEPTQSGPIPQPKKRADSPCPCGSTLKFEVCCGHPALFSPQLRPAA